MKTINKSILFIIFAAVSFSGCDNTFQPFVQGKVPYSVYGYLEAGRDTNFVRVAELDNPLLADSTQNLNIKKSRSRTLKPARSKYCKILLFALTVYIHITIIPQWISSPALHTNLK